MNKWHTENAVNGEWTRWISPMHGSGKRNYKSKCCDCGAVHELQFRIVSNPSRKNRLSVIFRAKRATKEAK